MFTYRVTLRACLLPTRARGRTRLCGTLWSSRGVYTACPHACNRFLRWEEELVRAKKEAEQAKAAKKKEKQARKQISSILKWPTITNVPYSAGAEARGGDGGAREAGRGEGGGRRAGRQVRARVACRAVSMSVACGE
eukprot:1184682-Prorocentrum_minimum.AAC.2